MSPTVTSIGLALLLGGYALPTAGAEWLHKQELEESCAALLWLEDKRDGAMCRGFVHGYLLGAEGAPPFPDATGDADAGTARESYSERALRTRISPAYVRRATSVEPVTYCLGDSIVLADVIQAIADYLESNPEAAGIIEPPMVQEALTRRFPCEG